MTLASNFKNFLVGIGSVLDIYPAGIDAKKSRKACTPKGYAVRLLAAARGRHRNKAVQGDTYLAYTSGRRRFGIVSETDR